MQFVVCVVWMGVDGVCQILRPDGRSRYSRDQIKDERDGSIEVETQKTEGETRSRSSCQRERERVVKGLWCVHEPVPPTAG